MREARKQAGLTQNDAAKALGVTYQAISNYERDKCRVEAGVLKQLCILYHCSATELLQPLSWSERNQALYDETKTDEERADLFALWGVPEDKLSEYEALQARLRKSAQKKNAVQTDGDAEELNLRRAEEELLTLFRQIPPSDRKLVLGMIEGALKSQGLLP